MTDSFADRFAKVRSSCGPAAWGLDPSGAVLHRWGLPDDADGLERFVDIAVAAAAGSIGIVKPQSAFYERHGWKGVRALARLISDARSAGLLVVLDAKRGDVGSTNEAYAAAYLGPDAPMSADALTVTAYLGLAAMDAFVERAADGGACLLVVTRSSNPEGRLIQTARTPEGLTVESSLLREIGELNRRLGGDVVGPVGAVVGPTHDPDMIEQLGAANALFLAPGVGAQGATLADVAACFAACPERVMPSASRALLDLGPDGASLREGLAAFASDAIAHLGA